MHDTPVTVSAAVDYSTNPHGAIRLACDWIAGVAAAAEFIAVELSAQDIPASHDAACDYLVRRLEVAAVRTESFALALLNVRDHARPRASVVGGPVTHWTITREQYEAISALTRVPLKLGTEMIDCSPASPIKFNPRS